jgi:hypothetical protein
VVILGFGALAFFAGWMALGARLLRRSALGAAAPGQAVPSISVIVPARNESPRVSGIVRSTRAQDHPDFELIVVDDRSVDGTFETACAAAEDDPRVRVLRVEARPDGWQGKLHALAAGAELARGQWLLFADADQSFTTPDLLRRLAADLERRNLAAVSLIARNTYRHWWDRLWIQPIVNNPMVWGTILGVQRLTPRSTWLIGSLALRRTTYESLGGARAAARCAAGAYDDWGWAASLRMRGQRTGMIYVPEFADATNFERFGDVVEGTSRWLAGIFSYRKGGWFTAGALFLAIAGLLAVVCGVALEMALGRPPSPGLAALAAIPFAIGLGVCRFNRDPWWVALGYPFVAALVLFGLGAAARVRIRNSVSWRGETMQVVSEDAPSHAPAPSSHEGAPPLAAKRASV